MFGLRLQCVLLLSKLQIICSNLYNLYPRQATTTFCSNQMSQHTADPNYLPVHLHRKTIEQKRIVSLIVSFYFSRSKWLKLPYHSWMRNHCHHNPVHIYLMSSRHTNQTSQPQSAHCSLGKFRLPNC